MANVSSFSGAMPVIPGGTVELGYTSKTSTVPINVGSGAQASVIGPLTVVCDGSPIMVEFFCEEASAPQTAGAYLIAALWVDGAETTRTMGVAYAGATGSNHGETLYAVQRITPSAGSHTIEIRGWSSAAANFYAGAGGTASYAPMWLRVSKIVNQNDGLKPFWTPPVVTQLPSQATVGDQVIYAANASDGVYWHLQYDGIGTYPWKFVGGAPVITTTSAYPAAQSNVSFTNITSGPSITIPLKGDYVVRHWGNIDINSPTQERVFLTCPATATVTPTDDTSVTIGAFYTSAGIQRTYWYGEKLMSGVSANESLTIQQKYAVGILTGVFFRCGLEMTPRRVG